MILLLDYRDSFTWNLAHQLTRLVEEPRVLSGYDVNGRRVLELAPSMLVLSPGPGTPAGAGFLLDVIQTVAGRIPILGICLGFQALGEHLGARLVQTGDPVHGHTGSVAHNGLGLFAGQPTPLEFMRYHSLALDPHSLPTELQIDAWCEGWPMALRHDRLGLHGLQFHPESFLSPCGDVLLAQFIRQARSFRSAH
ncbi:MAG: aminodeoxychorismate/anthranilate synthase component II [Candidatus Cloacimonetes bacterium]|nr:aminodeoxychorismate/anthranilate synthase component II [Candidatus Cloacimonadota bacterium]